jgi:LL-H family phage holin
MQEQITAILTPLVLAIIGALASVATVAVTAGKNHVLAWIKSKTNANQQAVIDRVAAEAYAYAEQWAGNDGQQKLNGAIHYVSQELEKIGINVSETKITAAIQAAWEQYGKK